MKPSRGRATVALGQDSGFASTIRARPARIAVGSSLLRHVPLARRTGVTRLLGIARRGRVSNRTRRARAAAPDGFQRNEQERKRRGPRRLHLKVSPMFIYSSVDGRRNTERAVTTVSQCATSPRCDILPPDSLRPDEAVAVLQSDPDFSARLASCAHTMLPSRWHRSWRSTAARSPTMPPSSQVQRERDRSRPRRGAAHATEARLPRCQRALAPPGTRVADAGRGVGLTSSHRARRARLFPR